MNSPDEGFRMLFCDKQTCINLDWCDQIRNATLLGKNSVWIQFDFSCFITIAFHWDAGHQLPRVSPWTCFEMRWSCSRVQQLLQLHSGGSGNGQTESVSALSFWYRSQQWDILVCRTLPLMRRLGTRLQIALKPPFIPEDTSWGFLKSVQDETCLIHSSALNTNKHKSYI